MQHSEKKLQSLSIYSMNLIMEKGRSQQKLILEIYYPYYKI